jgi:hypothetical protein
MIKGTTVGPTYGAIRPFKKWPAPGFPVYPSLADDLVQAGTAYNEKAAHVCSVLAGWAYSSDDTVATMMVRLGLEENRCRFIGLSNDTMFICSTAYLLQSKCGRLLLLAYRGTEPLNFINWLTDGDVNPVKIELPGRSSGSRSEPPRIHGGFYRNQRATWFDVEQGLRLALDGQSILGDGTKVAPVEALYITGHSLGAAMAALAAFRIAKDDAYGNIRERLRGVYTYGQPMVGNRAVADECEKDPILGRRVFRHIYKNDIVPVLPPSLAGEFAHFAPEYHSVNGKGGWAGPVKPGDYVKQLSHFSAPVVIAASAFAINQVPVLRRLAEVAQQVPVIERAGLIYSLYDHGTANYIQTSQPSGLASEFGDI